MGDMGLQKTTWSTNSERKSLLPLFLYALAGLCQPTKAQANWDVALKNCQRTESRHAMNFYCQPSTKIV